jgi:hypothetical protein
MLLSGQAEWYRQDRYATKRTWRVVYPEQNIIRLPGQQGWTRQDKHASVGTGRVVPGQTGCYGQNRQCRATGKAGML